jgi:hypothetical protein
LSGAHAKRRRTPDRGRQRLVWWRRRHVHRLLSAKALRVLSRKFRPRWLLPGEADAPADTSLGRTSQELDLSVVRSCINVSGLSLEKAQTCVARDNGSWAHLRVGASRSSPRLDCLSGRHGRLRRTCRQKRLAVLTAFVVRASVVSSSSRKSANLPLSTCALPRCERLIPYCAEDNVERHPVASHADDCDF